MIMNVLIVVREVRMRLRKIMGVVAIVTGIGTALVSPALAVPTQADTPRWGAPCAPAGDVGATRGGSRLVCEQRQGDDCPRWHNPEVETPGVGWARPSTAPCPGCSSPSASSPTSSSSSSGPVTPPVTPSRATAWPSVSAPAVGGPSGDQLPRTGVRVGAIVAAGLLLVLVGVMLTWRAREQRRGGS